MPKANEGLISYERSPFYIALKSALESRGQTIEDICPAGDHIARRVLHDYGAMFLASNDVLPPPVCMFTEENEVTRFHKAAGRAACTINDSVVELQPAAMSALLKARAMARVEELDISPRDGAEAARRTFADTVRLWNSRFFPALQHWTNAGKLTTDQTERLCALPLNQQALIYLPALWTLCGYASAERSVNSWSA